MNEVMRSDRVSVLRKGKLVGTVRTRDVTRDDLTMMMVGRPVAQVHARPQASSRSETPLRLERLSLTRGGRSYLSAIDLDIAAGEILGIAGVAGNGQDELLEAIAGLAPAGPVAASCWAVRSLRSRQRSGHSRTRRGLCAE